MKKIIRKVAAVTAGFAMLAGLAGGALAAGETLADLPEPFVMNSAYGQVAMVVGSAAGTNDNAARTTVKSYFDGFATAQAGDAAISGGYDREFYWELGFNGSTQFGKEVDDEKVSTLIDGKVDWGDKSYDIREMINFTAGAEISTSVNTTGSKEFGGDPYISMTAGSVAYLYHFDDKFKENDTTTQNLSSSTPLEITFLGKPLEITDISTTGNTISLKMAGDYTFKEGESQIVNGETVTAGSIFESSVEITLSGVTKIISKGSSFDFGDNTVKVDTIGYNANNPDLSKVILNIGTKVSDTVTDGEIFELFHDYDPDNDAPWEWEIETGNTAAGHWIHNIGIKLRLQADDLDISDSDPNPDPLGVGGVFTFPNNYAAISFDSITDASYCKVTIENKEDYDVNSSASSNSNGDNMDGFVWSGDQSNCFSVAGTDTSRVYTMKGTGSANNATWDIWYDTTEGIKKNQTRSTVTFNIDWGDTIMAVSFQNSTGSSNLGPNEQYIKIAKDTNADTRDQNIYLNVSQGFQEFGSTEDFDTGRYEVSYGTGGNTSATNIDLSGRDYQALTMYGIIVGDAGSNVEDDLDNDKVVLFVPNDRTQAVVSIGAGSQVTGDAVVEPVLTTESGASGYSNLILVGGPCVNSLTADYMGLTYPACEGASTITEDKAVIKLVEKKDKAYPAMPYISTGIFAALILWKFIIL